MVDPRELLAAYQRAREDLLAQRVAAGHWVGELASSALATATATSALSIVARASTEEPRRGACRQLAARGIQWLSARQNPDGGWGDTAQSLSNIATTMLVQAAFHLAAAADSHAPLLARAAEYVESRGAIAALRRRYGKDKTFAEPILTNCALAGLVPWSAVSPLPFEWAALPQPLWRLLRLPVVSYAIPALVAVGQARYCQRKPLNPLRRLLRWLSIRPSLKTLRRAQPASGGFLEAVPLTSFVAMSLAGTGRGDHPVVRRAVTFLLDSARGDGSWPIDTNLATWNTTLAIGALAAATGEVGALGCLDWLLGCQHRQVHPFTHAAPGGWGWSDLSGAVPDADDTAGALLALAVLARSAAVSHQPRIRAAAAAAVHWLLDLQNRDGGWPTFCRGWGSLPFDRSGSDLTAHALRALHAWRELGEEAVVAAAIDRALQYLAGQQRPDGSWLPLWFGNQHWPDEENPIYGTGRVLLCYRDLGQIDLPPARRGLAWLAAHRGPDGGWGGYRADSAASAVGNSSVEETAVALEALLAAQTDPSLQGAISEGLRWLISAVAAGGHRQGAPIGLYFAKLWYYERLYPLVFAVAALGQAVRRFCQ